MKLNEFHQMCPECGGPAFSSMILAEKKDACYYKVKASAKVWPSAYASGRLVQCRKKGAANYGNKSESVTEAPDNKCPPATQDITLNLKNRQKAIDEYGYGPLNPDMPNNKFWMAKQDEWNLDSVEEAQQSLCGNCAAFDIRQDTLDCIAQGIDADNPEDAEGVIDAGDLGYCKFLKFKCASRRTCDAWVTGGPLRDESGVAEGIGQQLSVQQLAQISDAALDAAYGYGRSSPGNTFGWQANLKSAAFAKQMIDRGVTDIEAISDAIHKGWNVTAQAFVKNPQMFDDSKTMAPEKLQAKIAQRQKLMTQQYAQLPEDEKEKDRVVARAMLQAIGSQQGVAEEWSQKYKSSINCSHPKGFSQKAHCAGKKKHNESIEMEMVCEDCGMCETHVDHQNLDEACWKGYHKEGNKELFGKTVPNCVKNTNEEASMADELDRILELGGVKLNEELVQEFDLIESIIEDLAERNGVDADVIWEDLDSLSDDELYVFAVTQEPINEDWQKANKRDRTAGMSQKAVNAYRRENPGSKLKTAVTTKPSKLKRGSKASKRRKSYCSRSRGQMKMHNISCAKTPDKAICKARRRWNC
jgi:hypothetical protein